MRNKKKIYLFSFIAFLLVVLSYAFFKNAGHSEYSFTLPEKVIDETDSDTARSEPASISKDSMAETLETRSACYSVSSSDDRATNVAMQVLEQGGNGVDAAVALAYTLTVVEPFASGIAGSGGMIVYDMNNDTCRFYDYRATAGHSSGSYDNVAVPGFVKGMEAVHKDYGTIEIGTLIEPAVHYASEGIQVNSTMNLRLQYAAADLCNYPFMYNGIGRYLSTGDIFVQEELAKSLQMIQEQGADAFYTGKLAEDIAAKTSLTMEDLAGYEVYVSDAVHGKVGDYTVYSATPPFSGVTLIQMLKMAEVLGLSDPSEDTTSYLSQVKLITQKAISCRYRKIADPSMYEVDTDYLLSDSYINEMLGIEDTSIEDDHESIETTSFSIVDYKNGLIVSSTNTLSSFWGNRKVIDGIFMNNTCKNFTSGSLNKYEPGKRSRTFTAPTIIVGDDGYLLAIGTPGGNNIPGVLFNVLSNILMFNTEPQEAVDRGRLIYRSGVLNVESGDCDTSWYDMRQIKGNMVWKNSSYWWGSVSLAGYSQEAGAFGAYDSRRGATMCGVYNP